MDTQNLRTMCLRELMNDVVGKIFCSICVAVTLEPELTWHVCSLSNVAWMIVMTSGSNTWACYSSNRHYGVVLLWHLNTLIWRFPVFWWNLYLLYYKLVHFTCGHQLHLEPRLFQNAQLCDFKSLYSLDAVTAESCFSLERLVYMYYSCCEFSAVEYFIPMWRRKDNFTYTVYVTYFLL